MTYYYIIITYLLQTQLLLLKNTYVAYIIYRYINILY